MTWSANVQYASCFSVRSCMAKSITSLLFTILVACAGGAATAEDGAGHWEVGKEVSLFDGKSLAGWTTAGGDAPAAGWVVEDGCLVRASRGGNIFYHQPVGDFDLRFQWKIVKGGNNGIKYRVRSYGGQMLGCEYQLLGETSPSFTKGSTGSLYALFEPNQKKKLNPPEQWNDARIVVQGAHIEHWLNGAKIVNVEVGSEPWEQRLSQSKFAPHIDFARNQTGRIMITDHGAKVWYRNMTLTPLASKPIPAAPSARTVRPLNAEVASHYHVDPSVFQRFSRAHNVLVVGSSRVNDRAMGETAHQLHQLMTAMRSHLAGRIRDRNVVCVVLAFGETLSEVWPHDPKTSVDDAAVVQEIDGRTVMAVSGAKVLAYPSPGQTESHLVRAYAELVRQVVMDPRLAKRLDDAYQQAMKRQRWQDAGAVHRVAIRGDQQLLPALQAAFPQLSPALLRQCIEAGDVTVNGKRAKVTSTLRRDDDVSVHVPLRQTPCLAAAGPADYWAEGVQSWFDVNQKSDFQHNAVRTRKQLKQYDAQLARLCTDILRDLSWQFDPPVTIETPDHLLTAANADKSWEDHWRQIARKYAVK